MNIFAFLNALINDFYWFLDQEILQKLVIEEAEKRSAAKVQEINSNDQNKDNNAEITKTDEKDTFTWPEKAVMLFLKLYREREDEFTAGLKRHSKLWSEIASELHNLNYNVSAVQVQNKMSSLKRTYKKIKDSNAKSGNHNSSWAYYSVVILYLATKVGFLLQL